MLAQAVSYHRRALENYALEHRQNNNTTCTFRPIRELLLGKNDGIESLTPSWKKNIQFLNNQRNEAIGTEKEEFGNSVLTKSSSFSGVFGLSEFRNNCKRPSFFSRIVPLKKIGCLSPSSHNSSS